MHPPQQVPEQPLETYYMSRFQNMPVIPVHKFQSVGLLLVDVDFFVKHFGIARPSQWRTERKQQVHKLYVERPCSTDETRLVATDYCFVTLDGVRELLDDCAVSGVFKKFCM